MSNISSQILKKIRNEKITPIPRWHFVLKSFFIWMMFVINLLCGIIGTAIIIFLSVNNDLVLDKTLVKNSFERIFLIIPILWIVITIFFLFVAYYNFKHTETGYKYSALGILFLNIFISLIFGIAIYKLGGANVINNFFNKHIPYYSSALDTRIKVWMRPEVGYLAGDIKSIDRNTLKILDLYGNTWSIDIKNANVKHFVILNEGERIKILGKIMGDNVFSAYEIRPWNSIRRNMQEN